VPGQPIDQSSYRGELGGILAALTYTNKICREAQTEGTCTLACDNEGALAASFGWKTPNPNWKGFGIVSMIRYQLRNSAITWKCRHVKGHQDDAEKFKDLDAASQANVIADENAKEEWKKDNTPCTENTIGQPWKITCKGKLLTGNVESRLRTIIYEEPTRKWWLNKCYLEPNEEQSIDWEVYASYRKITLRWRNTWSVKFGADLLPTGQNLERRGHSTSPACPWCNEEIEITNHIFLCTHDEMEKCFSDELEKIEDFLRVSTSKEIRESIVTLLQGLRKGEILLPDEDTDLSLTMEKQFDLGQRATLNGMWHKEWCLHQMEYNKKIKSRKSAKVWLVRLQIKIQDMVHIIWKTRNEAIHKTETSEINKARNEDLDQKIEELYTDLPSLRLFRPSDRAIFKRKKERIKNYRIINKENWVTTATRVKDAYYHSLTPAATAFLEFFGVATIPTS
jgi:hypothetical protein